MLALVNAISLDSARLNIVSVEPAELGINQEASEDLAEVEENQETEEKFVEVEENQETSEEENTVEAEITGKVIEDIDDDKEEKEEEPDERRPPMIEGLEDKQGRPQ